MSRQDDLLDMQVTQSRLDNIAQLGCRCIAGEKARTPLSRCNWTGRRGQLEEQGLGEVGGSLGREGSQELVRTVIRSHEGGERENNHPYPTCCPVDLYTIESRSGMVDRELATEGWVAVRSWMGTCVHGCPRRLEVLRHMCTYTIHTYRSTYMGRTTGDLSLSIEVRSRQTP